MLIAKDNGNKYDKIFVILKPMPKDMQQISMKCDMKIHQKKRPYEDDDDPDRNAMISGIVHFRQNKLTALMVKFMGVEWTINQEMPILVNMSVIATY